MDKSYKSGTFYLNVLKKINLSFRENEFVSILGPSGSGKTTLLNLIGGLDHYDSGDLIINQTSTKHFSDREWDSYRNRSIGFVFQNYNLISHQSVLQNVEIALTLSGVSADEREKRARKVLTDVGLADQIEKKPNQLSGGQMQRVAIARALVNNPDIILADEPTGALDSKTSVQVMDLLKEIAKTRLVIMVTHNEKIATKYSTRLIHILDGKIQSDSDPIEEEEITPSEDNPVKKRGKNKNKTAMSMVTALSLSFKNLLTKKGRTIMTAFAGSIGIIGVALVLALSNGLTNELDVIQGDTLSNFPLTIDTNEQFATFEGANQEEEEWEAYPDADALYPYTQTSNFDTHTNVLSADFLEYLEDMETSLSDEITSIRYRQGVGVNLLARNEGSVRKFESDAGGQVPGPPGFNQTSFWQEMPDDDLFITDLYDLIGEDSRLPEGPFEVAIVVDEYNRISADFIEMIGLNPDETYQLTDFIGEDFLRLIPNDLYYSERNGIFVENGPDQYEAIYEDEQSEPLTITGILRVKEEETSYFDEGFIYRQELTEWIMEDANQSEIATTQEDSEVNVFTGNPFDSEEEREQVLLSLGTLTQPIGIDIYPANFEAKEVIKAELDQYNEEVSQEDQIIYNDLAEVISDIMTGLINTVTYVLVGFAGISLVVSTIMIGIITYVSVIERTKEIGILRSVGARKKDISRVFNAETLIIGFVAGTLGIGLSYLLVIPINLLIEVLSGSQNVAMLSPAAALILIGGSMFLTLIAGLIPSRMAAKKDPVIALRSE